MSFAPSIDRSPELARLWIDEVGFQFRLSTAAWEIICDKANGDGKLVAKLEEVREVLHDRMVIPSIAWTMANIRPGLGRDFEALLKQWKEIVLPALDAVGERRARQAEFKPRMTEVETWKGHLDALFGTLIALRGWAKARSGDPNQRTEQLKQLLADETPRPPLKDCLGAWLVTAHVLAILDDFRGGAAAEDVQRARLGSLLPDAESIRTALDARVIAVEGSPWSYYFRGVAFGRRRHLDDLKHCRTAWNGLVESLRGKESGLKKLDSLWKTRTERDPPLVLYGIDRLLVETVGASPGEFLERFDEVLERSEPERVERKSGESPSGGEELVECAVDAAQPFIGLDRSEVWGELERRLARLVPVGVAVSIVRRVEDAFDDAEFVSSESVDCPMLFRCGIVFADSQTGRPTRLRPAGIHEPVRKSPLVAALGSFRAACLTRSETPQEFRDQLSILFDALRPARPFAQWWESVNRDSRQRRGWQRFLLQVVGAVDTDLAPQAGSLLLALADEGVVVREAKNHSPSALMVLPRIGAVGREENRSPVREELVELALLDDPAEIHGAVFFPPHRLTNSSLLRLLDDFRVSLAELRAADPVNTLWNAIDDSARSLGYANDSSVATASNEERDVARDLFERIYATFVGAEATSKPRWRSLGAAVLGCLARLGGELQPPLDPETLEIADFDVGARRFPCEWVIEPGSSAAGARVLRFARGSLPARIAVRLPADASRAGQAWSRLPPKDFETPFDSFGDFSRVRAALLRWLRSPQKSPVDLESERTRFRNWALDDGRRFVSQLLCQSSPPPERENSEFRIVETLRQAEWIRPKTDLRNLIPLIEALDCVAHNLRSLGERLAGAVESLSKSLFEDAVFSSVNGDFIRTAFVDMIAAVPASLPNRPDVAAEYDGLVAALAAAGRPYEVSISPVGWSFQKIYTEPPADIAVADPPQASFADQPPGTLRLDSFQTIVAGRPISKLRLIRSAGFCPSSVARVVEKLQKIQSDWRTDFGPLIRELTMTWPQARLQDASTFAFQAKHYFARHWKAVQEAEKTVRDPKFDEALDALDEATCGMFHDLFEWVVFEPQTRAEFGPDWEKFLDVVNPTAGKGASDSLEVVRPGLMNERTGECVCRAEVRYS